MQHEEEKRVQRMELVLRMREEVIQQETVGAWSPNQKMKASRLTSSGANKSTLI